MDIHFKETRRRNMQVQAGIFYLYGPTKFFHANLKKRNAKGAKNLSFAPFAFTFSSLRETLVSLIRLKP